MKRTCVISAIRINAGTSRGVGGGYLPTCTWRYVWARDGGRMTRTSLPRGLLAAPLRRRRAILSCSWRWWIRNPAAALTHYPETGKKWPVNFPRLRGPVLMLLAQQRRRPRHTATHLQRLTTPVLTAAIRGPKTNPHARDALFTLFESFTRPFSHTPQRTRTPRMTVLFEQTSPIVCVSLFFTRCTSSRHLKSLIRKN